MADDLARSGEFPGGNRLIEIVNAHKWELIDLSRAPIPRFISYHDMDLMERARDIEYDRNYLFVPMARQGVRPSQIYERTGGIGPAIKIHDPFEDRWGERVIVARKGNGYVAIFTTMALLSETNTAFMTSAKGQLMNNPDLVEIRCHSLVDTFEKYFCIVQPEELIAVPEPGMKTN